MPIKFRCPHCRQFLGISRSKASTVTDCPTCGRTIRVPNLDGNVDPVPPPKLNLNDSDLRQALGALASLEGDNDLKLAEQFQVESALFKPSAHPSQLDEDFPEVLAEAVEKIEAPVGSPTEEPQDFFDHLEEIIQGDYAVPFLDPESQSMTRKRRNTLILMCLVLVFLLGFFFGRVTAPYAARADLATLDPVVEVCEPQEPVEGDEILTLEVGSLAGEVTYVSSSGEIRPDKGARILLLPLQRKGTSKLPGDGFRVGASEVDQRVIQAAAKELGGGMSLTTESGKYILRDMIPGRYTVLIASRYQAAETRPQSGEVHQFLETYFEFPKRLIGQVAYHSQEVEIQTNIAFELNFLFPGQ